MVVASSPAIPELKAKKNEVSEAIDEALKTVENDIYGSVRTSRSFNNKLSGCKMWGGGSKSFKFASLFGGGHQASAASNLSGARCSYDTLPFDCSSAAVLLAVRKSGEGVGDDSNYCSSNSSKECSPLLDPRSGKGKSSGISFFGWFQKSNSAKVQKRTKQRVECETVSEPTQKSSSSSEQTKLQSNTTLTSNLTARQPLMSKLKRRKGGKFAVSYSMSSLNGNRPSTPRKVNLVLSTSAVTEPTAGKMSSTTSVDSTMTSSTEEESGGIGSNYDSGAFSRTSSPTDELAFSENESHRRYLSHNLLPPPPPPPPTLPGFTAAAHEVNRMRLGLSMSTTRLAFTGEPLNSPGLVLDAISTSELNRTHHKQKVDPSLVWDCLDAASDPLERHFVGGRRLHAPDPGGAKGDGNMVSVTVGANTMLTITSEEVRSLRKSRSGVPLLGTSGLSPARPSQPRNSKCSKLRGQRRNRISTVYIHEGAKELINNVDAGCAADASGCLVTVMGSAPANCGSPSKQNTAGLGYHCQCTEVVTVNGQHFHCMDTRNGRRPMAR